MARINLEAVITAKDNASKVFNGVIKNASSVGDKFSAVGKKMTVGLTLPIIGAGVASVKTFSDFETRLSNISTLISGDSTKAVKAFEVGIKDMLKEVPKTADDLGASAYDIVSAGISDTATALKVLKASSKLAVAGLGETQEATDILTSSINAFQLDAEDADKISNLLFKTVKNGKTTVSELAQAFGATAPVVAAAGISLEEFQAATAALTTTGQPASQAQNSLRQAVVALNKPTKEMAALLKGAGYASGEAALKQDGLVKVMSRVKGEAKGSAEMLGKAWGSVEALGASTALTGPVNKAYADTLKDMKGSSDDVTEAFEKQKETTSAQFQLLKNELGVSMMDFANEIMPTVKVAVEKVTGAIKSASDWFNNLNDDEKKLTLGLLAAAAAAGPVMSFIGVIWKAVAGINAASAAITAAGGLIPAIGGLATALAVPFLVVVAIGSVITAIIKIKELIGLYGELARKEGRLTEVTRQGDRIDNLIKQYRDGKITKQQFDQQRDIIMARADGGPVKSGQTYLVGERGPELFTPKQTGQIVPNEQMGGNVTINNYNTFKRDTDPIYFARELAFRLA